MAGAIGFLQKKFALSPAMEGWAASCALLGCVIGVAISGLFSDRFGRRKLLVLSGLLRRAASDPEHSLLRPSVRAGFYRGRTLQSPAAA
ncbi:MAG: MFS transporter, partial [Acidobacteriota bacterium]